LRRLPDQLGCPLRLIGGNHELGSQIEGLPQEEAQGLGPLWLSHAPDPRPGWLNVCGHVHPVALISGGADRLRLPCFAFRPPDDCLVLPAFGHLTGGHPCKQGESLWLVVDEVVLAWTNATPPSTGRRRGQAA
jgi:metallophosphoesterase superfamily enzyme